MEDLPLDRLAAYVVYDEPWHEPATYPRHPHRVLRLLLFWPGPHVVALGLTIPKTGVTARLKALFAKYKMARMLFLCNNLFVLHKIVHFLCNTFCEYLLTDNRICFRWFDAIR